MRFGIVWLAVVALPAAETPATWTPSLSMRVQTVGDVTPSPDGQWVLWTQTRAVLEEEKSEIRTHVFLARSDGSGRVQLTQGEKSATQPRFSPDGRFVFFLSERTGKPNLYRIPVSGGEAEQLTDWKGRISSFAVSPDGKHIAFVGADEDKEEEKRKKQKNDYKIIDEQPKNQTLFVFSLDGPPPAKPRRLTEPNRHAGDLDWSPDSSRIAFERRPTPDADDGRKSDLAEVEIATGTVREIAATTATETDPQYSPDGRYLAFLRSAENPNTVDGQRFVLLSRTGSGLRELPPTHDQRPQPLGWASDSRAVYFVEARGTRPVVYRMPLDGPPAAVFSPARGRFTARLNETATHLGFALETPEEPVEAFVAPVDSPQPRRVSEANLSLPKAALGKTELTRWKAQDGLEIEGLITYPVGYQPGKRVPLILNIHGGPSGVFQESFIGAPGQYPIASFAAKGYAVLRPNPRGSGGYGRDFRRRVIEDWGGRDFQDLMSGVDHLIASGVADPDRMAVMGWSYGGYMTAWTVTQTHRFKAAAVGAGITNTVSMYGTQDIPSVFEDYFGGTPWSRPEVYSRTSPLQFIANARTPTLLLHGENDARVPPGQAYEFYRALKRQGVPTRLIVYPRMPHGPREPKFQLHIMEQHLEWVEKYLR
jgi:dipeptidyl aminopeptidase/acylaminoacyl peptidase